MWDFSLSRSFGLMARTVPFIAFRLLVYLGIALAYVLVTGLGAGVGWGVGVVGGGDFQASTTFWGGLIGFALTAGVIYFMREYILYIVKAGHIAVLVKLMDGEAVPNGQGQISYASDIVRQRFGEASVLFAVDQRQGRAWGDCRAGTRNRNVAADSGPAECRGAGACIPEDFRRTGG